MNKLNKKTAVALSLLFALLTVSFWSMSMRRASRQVQAREIPMITVATAMADINPRTVIQPGMVRFTQVRANERPQNALSSTGEVYDKVAMRIIPAGTPITSDAVADKGPALGMAYNLPPNMRAVSVPLDPVSGVAGFLKPGDHVDVLATYSGQGVDITRTVLQDIELLAIGSRPINTAQYQSPNGPAVGGGQNPNQATTDAPTATLSVWPDQAQVLVLAAAKARIHLALRGPNDAAPSPLASTTTGKVFGVSERPSAPPPPAPAPAPVMVRETAPAPPPAPRPMPAAAPTAPKPEAPKPEARDTSSVTVIRGTQQTQVEVPD